MYGKVTKTVAGANSNSAMGRETISKSRVSPKNVRSRGNILSGMKRILLLTAIIFVCGTYKSFGQFNDMSDLYLWLNQSNQQTQQIMSQMFEMYGKALSESQRQFNESLEKAKKAEVERLAALTVDDDKSYYFKDAKTGKYGAVIFLNGEIGFNNGFNPVKVYYNQGRTTVDITSKSVYFSNIIILPAMFTIDMFEKRSSSNALYIWFGLSKDDSIDMFGIFDHRDAEAIKNYDKYNSLITYIYNVIANSSGMSVPSFSGSSSSSSGSTPTTYAETCSMCSGTGEVVASSASFTTGTKWCSKCRMDVVNSHYHNNCPSCGGTGKRTRIR